MSYLVLARKWRPKRFAELVGQEHVVRALSNALDSGRVHHAFLFTGTRGVGKTTIARIFAKSLNCERGVGAEPCGECAVCTAVDAGRFVDLIEIDAASNTGVDDVREVIENAQYMPTRGRYKVYLVDEVHMLSRNAFNALLKTLEEPPEHVKFLLATTDPQKLPVTVLSRCLQFNLKRLTPEQIAAQMRHILSAESIAFDDGAIAQLADAADGSLRDGLSLLDQAIAYGGGALNNGEVAAMLGTVDRTQVAALLDALSAGDGPALLAAIEHLAGFAPDFGAVLDALAQALHKIQLQQLVPGAAGGDGGFDVASIAAAVSAELVQLWYQMAISGRRELPLAPTPRVGFEMVVLRMLAFRPVGGAGASAGEARTVAPPAHALAANMRAGEAAAAPARSAHVDVREPATRQASDGASPLARAAAALSAVFDGGPKTPRAAAPAIADAMPQPAPVVERAAPVAVVREPAREHDPRPAAIHRHLHDANDWLDTVGALGLKGPAHVLASHAGFVGHADGRLRLSLPDEHEHFRTPSLIAQLANALAGPLGSAPQIEFVAAPALGETLRDRTQRERGARQADAEHAFMTDPSVQRLINEYGARVVPDSIRPLDS